MLRADRPYRFSPALILALVLAADFLLLSLPGQRNFEICFGVCGGEEGARLCAEFEPELNSNLIRWHAQIAQFCDYRGSCRPDSVKGRLECLAGSFRDFAGTSDSHNAF